MADTGFFYKAHNAIALTDIARAVDAKNIDRNIDIYDVKPLEAAQDTDITFFSNLQYKQQLANTKAAACIVSTQYANLVPEGVIAVVCARPYMAYAKVCQMFYPEQQKNTSHVADTAIISNTAQLGKNCQIDDYAVIGQGVKIGDNAHIAAHVVIDRNVKIGDNAVIQSHASISHAIIGKNVHIYAGARIGQRGFGFAIDGTQPVKLPQLGRVMIGDNVEIGANTCVDRGSGHDTVLEDGVMIDNMVQIAHNVHVGAGTVMAAQSGVAGSTKIGHGCMIGGQAGLTGHATIGNGVQVGAGSGVVGSIEDGQVVAGYPAIAIKTWLRMTAWLKKQVRV